jgi:hypothetical protein
LFIEKVYSKENFSSNPSKLPDKNKVLEVGARMNFNSKMITPKTYSSGSNTLSSGSSGIKTQDKNNNLNDQCLKRIMSCNNNTTNNENVNKNVVNTILSSEKLKLNPLIEKGISTKSNEKKVKSFNFDNKDSKMMKTFNSLNQFHTINTDAPLEAYQYPDLDKVKISHKNFGIVEAYAAITTEGIVRNYNEDRVSIILNIPKSPNYTKDDWPKCSFFGIYDGHGGANCAEFLRDNLHKNVRILVI